MSKHEGTEWLCPLCTVQQVPYPKSGHDFDNCGNELNINGRWYQVRGYLGDKSLRDKSLRDETVTSIGMSGCA